MNISDLIPTFDFEKVLVQYQKQFGKSTDSLANLTLHECKTFLQHVRGHINRYKGEHGIFESEKDPKYINLLMIREATQKRITELTETQEQAMKTAYLNALKHVAKGGQLSEEQKQDLGVSPKLLKILEDRKATIKFMEHIVRSKKVVNEGVEDVDTAQIVLAAQDMVDQVQDMIEKFADIQYKELPALQDGIRKEISVETAESFKQQVLSAIENLTQSLESAKTEFGNAVSLLTGDEIVGGGDLDLENPEDADLDMDLDFGDEEEALPPEEEEELGEPGEELGMEPGEEEEDELANFGREKR